ncbi:MAG: aminotransferase class I/II-fold pyridoxal phosphate-dependent enzyme [Pseudomonadota bacterium]
MDTNFSRLDMLPPYVFAEVNALKLKLRQEGRDVIDFGMGNPDQDPPQHVTDKLIETASRGGVSRYSASQGIKGLRKAKARYYQRRYNVDLDPDSDIIVSLGSKEGFANLAMAITSPGDVFVIPNPTYPIHPYGFLIAGGSIRHIQCFTNGRFDPEHYMRTLHDIVHNSLPKPKAIVVNFPSNPTAQMCDLDFYTELVAFAKKNEIWLISDLAYSEVYYTDAKPRSILEVPGAKDVAIEFTSLSKTYSMAGWRIGFAVGNPTLVAALKKIKSYLDYGAFTPVQVAAVAALDSEEHHIETMRNTYIKRRATLVSALSNAGWDIEPPSSTMFAWSKIPDKFHNMGSFEFAKMLLNEAAVAVAPGAGFGQYGEGYVRIGLVENDARIRQAAKQIKRAIDL